MKKVFYLSTCDTCKKIIKNLGLKEKGFQFQDIKTNAITVQQLNELKDMAGSFEALFSKVSKKYKALNLADKQLTENEMKDYILNEYTFLKRPVIVVGKRVFIGNSKTVVEEVIKHIN